MKRRWGFSAEFWDQNSLPGAIGEKQIQRLYLFEPSCRYTWHGIYKSFSLRSGVKFLLLSSKFFVFLSSSSSRKFCLNWIGFVHWNDCHAVCGQRWLDHVQSRFKAGPMSLSVLFHYSDMSGTE